MSGSSESHAFRFQAVPLSWGPEEYRLFSGRLRRALRAAHGLQIPLEMRWRSGPDGTPTLRICGAVALRWMQFGLSGAYDLGQWTPAEPEGVVVGESPMLRVHLGGSSDLPLPSQLDEPSWSEPILAELQGTTPGITVEWEMVPDPTVPALEENPAARAVPTHADTRTRETLRGNSVNSALSPRTGLRWSLQGVVWSRPTPAIQESGMRIARLIEEASHRNGGNRLVCRKVASFSSILRRSPLLGEDELVGLFPPPVSRALSQGPRVPNDRTTLWLGRDSHGASVGVPLDPGQGRHLLVLGETGMGKSSLVVRLAWQASRWGTVVLLDPIGDTAREFLSGLSATDAPRTVWLTPSLRGLSLSLLDEVRAKGKTDAARQERVLADIVMGLRRVRAGRYADSSYWGPRLEEMLFLALRAASAWPEASLVLAERLLSPGGRALRDIPLEARDSVTEIFHRIETAPQDGDGARRLLSEISRSQVLRGLLDADQPTWRMEKAVARGRITVVSGDAPQAGESVARYLLAVVLALTWNAVLSRKSPIKTFLILDEAQWYAHETVGEILRLGRRFNVHLWAATQALSSLPETVREAFRTNSSDVVLFRGDPLDVRDVSRWLPDLPVDRVMRLPRGTAVVLLGKGSATHWVNVPPPRPVGTDPLLFATRERPVSEVAPATPAPEGLPERSPDRTPLPPTAGIDEGSSLDPWLLETLGGNGGLPEHRVYLAELRSQSPAPPAGTERWIRNAGRRLSLSGVIVRSGGDDRGSYWIVSRPRLQEYLSERRPAVAGTESMPSPSRPASEPCSSSG